MLGGLLLTLAAGLLLWALTVHRRAWRERLLWERFELAAEISLDEIELPPRQRRLAQRLLRVGVLIRTPTGKLVPQAPVYAARRHRRRVHLSLLWLAALGLAAAGTGLALR